MIYTVKDSPERNKRFRRSTPAFGTAARHKLPLKIIILNNGGIGQGVAEPNPDLPPLPHALMHGARYERMAEGFGGAGFYVTEPDELGDALDAAMAHDGLAIVNVVISPTANC